MRRTGYGTVVRVNGQATLSVAPELIDRFDQKGRHPTSVIVVSISEIYTQCARAILRAGLWTQGDISAGLPSAGDILDEMTGGEINGADYDKEWPKRAAETMW